MKTLRVKAVVTGSLFGLSLTGLALAGTEHGPGGPQMHASPMLQAHWFERADTNKDGQVTRVEAQSAAENLFDRMDANKDGEVTRKESEESAKTIAREEVDARFKTLDANNDGRLSLQESKLSEHFFAKLDTNGDKSLTRDELAAGNHFGIEQFAFKRADTNGDGKVTRAEATQAALTRFDGADTNHDKVLTQAELQAHAHAKGEHAK